MLRTRPFCHVGANLTHHLERGVGIHTVDPGQVNPRHPVQVRPNVEAWGVSFAASPARLRRWKITIAVILETLQLGFNLPVALGNLILIEPVQLQGLGQLEDVLFPPVALQRLGDGRLVGLDPGVAQLRQSSRVPLATHDCLHDVHAGLAGDIADDVVELHVHLGQGFLHMLDMVGCVLHQHDPLPQVTA